MADDNENPMLWYWGYGKDPETYQGGWATRDEAVADARASCDPDDTVTIVRANKSMPSTDIFNADNVVETYQDCNEDCVNEDGELPNFNPTKEQLDALTADLNATFAAWLRKHKLYSGGWAFDKMENEEQITFPA